VLTFDDDPKDIENGITMVLESAPNQGFAMV
jgi:hypothetical protein